MHELLIHGAAGDTQLPFSDSQKLSDLLSFHPDSPGKPCGGSGKCGKCAVFAKGDLNPQPDQYGKVLACQTYAIGNAEIWLPRNASIQRIETASLGDFYTLSPLGGHYAFSVDIGTTTLAAQLIRLHDGKILSIVACENPQRIFSADVIGRIDSAMNGHLPMLHSMINEAVLHMEEEAIRLAGLPIEKADYRIITGNTTMLYLFTNRNPREFARAPFQADCLFGFWDGRDYFPPCAGTFVGADITCALLFSGMCKEKSTALLIDIGTNGEIVLWHNGKIYCCATAAGPAFEGGGIECGCGSISGAIDSARVENGKLVFTTIDDKDACGICGSGLIDLTAALLDLGVLDENGTLDDKEICIAPNVKLTQKDIRQIQLAKGAIAAGICSLLKMANIDAEKVSALYIAGGFGSHLNIENAAHIGLFPKALASKVVVLGNAALGGARRLSLDKIAFDHTSQIAENAECINLADTPFFTDAFMECMLFD